jgi:hypothetical protein
MRTPTQGRRPARAVVATLIIVTIGAVVAAACGTPDATSAGGDATTTTAPANDLLYVGTEDGIAALDPVDGEVAFHAAGAVPAGDWSVLWTTRAAGIATELIPLDPVTGAEGDSGQRLDDTLTARLASHDGRAVVLMRPRVNVADPYLPEPRVSTRLVVARSDGTARTYDLDGNFEPEAFSLDTSSLFVVQYFPPMAPDRYQVRRLDLDSGEVEVVFDVDDTIQPEMGGVARTHVRAPDGKRLYTLYTVDAPEPKAFIHVVSLEDEWAHCIDLPVEVAAGSEASLALTITPDGRELVVADRATGDVTIVDTEALDVARTGNVGPSAEPVPAVAATDGETLYLGTTAEVVDVDLASLDPRGSWDPDLEVGELRGIALSDDGHELFVGKGATVIARNATDGLALRAMQSPSIAFIAYVGRNAAPIPVNLGATECAC